MLSSERTRLFHKYLVLLITAALVGFVIAAPLSRVTAFAADQENQPSLEAISALLVDARRGQVIYSKTLMNMSRLLWPTNCWQP